MVALAKAGKQGAGSLSKKGRRKVDEKRVREAIKMLRRECKEIMDFYENISDSSVARLQERKIEPRETAIEALEKQLPKKVEYDIGYINNGFTKYRMAKCPNCDRWHSSRDEIIYCSKCGQRLDWSE